MSEVMQRKDLATPECADEAWESGYRAGYAAAKPRTITTVEELDALPDGALIMLSGEHAQGGRSIFETRRASLFRDPIPLTEPPRWGLVSMQDDAGIPARDLLHLPGELTLILEPTTETAQ